MSTINGNNGSDVDRLAGSVLDILSGNGGNDTFVYKDFGDTGDLIMDWASGDKIAFTSDLNVSFELILAIATDVFLSNTTTINVDVAGGSATD